MDILEYVIAWLFLVFILIRVLAITKNSDVRWKPVRKGR